MYVPAEALAGSHDTLHSTHLYRAPPTSCKSPCIPAGYIYPSLRLSGIYIPHPTYIYPSRDIYTPAYIYILSARYIYPSLHIYIYSQRDIYTPAYIIIYIYSQRNIYTLSGIYVPHYIYILSAGYICSAPTSNFRNARIAQRKLGILTLPRNPSIAHVIPGLTTWHIRASRMHSWSIP